MEYDKPLIIPGISSNVDHKKVYIDISKYNRMLFAQSLAFLKTSNKFFILGAVPSARFKYMENSETTNKTARQYTITGDIYDATKKMTYIMMCIRNNIPKWGPICFFAIFLISVLSKLIPPSFKHYHKSADLSTAILTQESCYDKITYEITF